ncbi:1-aminocyclopropane-1-carboxylate deaminase/D-cysteine desulfhydrase [Pseudonocardia alaniniphila]|uniref:Pyridoxal-phosphate dependent enzyme n=1 Tax=Pseudonocardia alaniniphila TaxID=75291 RepID=A0ABS9TPC9_9PSEU|nr:pyridoxal-phosphate dependent enzyme [Pseudonocardia alaniniphila]MCH6170402.1 pyridoxal-phosphate dependent enzyme [Pseudonocardia alaniniphila]
MTAQPGEVPQRFPLAVLPTPLVRAERLEAVLGCGTLLVKRDDLSGFGVAGNKARALEYLVGAALAQGTEVLVTGGGPGSNFVPAAALAARAAGLDCEIVLWGDPHGATNVAIAEAAGARILPTGRYDREEVDVLAAQRAAELTLAGRPATAVPRGGSTPIGALGFADAAAELMGQLSDAPPPVEVVLPLGSGGSCAGLLAGLAAAGATFPVVAVSVSRPPEDVRRTVLAMARECAALRGTTAPTSDQLELVDARGEGFGTATEQERRRARLALHTEGLFLDTTYGAEAFSVAVDRLLGRPPGPVVWWHTGGLVPAVAHVTGAGPSGGAPAPAMELDGGARR